MKKTERNLDILNQWKSGLTYTEIAKNYQLSVERVRSISRREFKRVDGYKVNQIGKTYAESQEFLNFDNWCIENKVPIDVVNNHRT